MRDNRWDDDEDDIEIKVKEKVKEYCLFPYFFSAKKLYGHFYEQNHSESKSKVKTNISLLALTPVLLPTTAVTTTLCLSAMCALSLISPACLLIFQVVDEVNDIAKNYEIRHSR